MTTEEINAELIAALEASGWINTVDQKWHGANCQLVMSGGTRYCTCEQQRHALAKAKKAASGPS